MSATDQFSHCAVMVRGDDHDRFLTALFAPAARREDLFALYAFNLEVATTRERVSEPALGEIRLQWWREALDGICAGTPRTHPVVAALARAVARVPLDRGQFDRLIDARAADLDDQPPASLAELEAYAADTSSSLMRLALQALGGLDDASARAAEHAGIAWALTGLIRAVPFHGAQGRVYLPRDLLEVEGIDPFAVPRRREPEKLRNVVAKLAAEAERHLYEAREDRRKMSRVALPALLPASLAGLYLARLRQTGYDLADPGLEIAAPRRLIRLLWNAIRNRY